MMECEQQCQPIDLKQGASLEYKIFSDAQSLFVYNKESVDKLVADYTTCFEKNCKQAKGADSCSIEFLYALDKINFYYKCLLLIIL